MKFANAATVQAWSLAKKIKTSRPKITINTLNVLLVRVKVNSHGPETGYFNTIYDKMPYKSTANPWTKMATPIKDTPILYGKDAIAFEKAMREAEKRKVPAEDYERAEKAYNELIARNGYFWIPQQEFQ